MIFILTDILFEIEVLDKIEVTEIIRVEKIIKAKLTKMGGHDENGENGCLSISVYLSLFDGKR